ncbi:MAG: hypothetical protein JW840_10040 [Candidatus Thermoplasmatota archaeon]|nr:hypothetical protein [Candidatus Thermoplasmatota archaeon]
MKNLKIQQSFLKNTQAVSEEFTVLPALTIVIIGFTLFIVLLAQTYITYTDHINRLQKYQTADNILQKITNTDSYFIRECGLVDLQVLKNDTESLHSIRKQYAKTHIDFFLRIQWNNQTQDFPPNVTPPPHHTCAISKEIGIYLNEAHTVPGVITLILWGDY